MKVVGSFILGDDFNVYEQNQGGLERVGTYYSITTSTGMSYKISMDPQNRVDMVVDAQKDMDLEPILAAVRDKIKENSLQQ